MKKSIKLITKVSCSFMLVAVFLLISCDHDDQADGNIPEKDSAFLTPHHGQEIKPYNERLAEQKFVHHCAACHGVEGKGDGFNAVNLEQKPPDFTDAEYMKLLTHEYLVQAILTGGQAVNKSPLMPAWGNTLSDDNIQRLAIYVRNFAGDPKGDN